MAKKKNTSKKHKFKHAEQAAGQVSATATEVGTTGAVSSPRPRAAAVGGATGHETVRDFSYVSGDVRRIAVMAVSLIALELILYYVLVHTSFGASVYQLVKI